MIFGFDNRPGIIAVAAAGVGHSRLFVRRLRPDRPKDIPGSKPLVDMGQSAWTAEQASVLPPKGPITGNVKVTKGRILHRQTQSYKEFMFNPETIKAEDGWHWGTADIPGMSVPIVGGGSGVDRPITFTVFLDADRGRSEDRKFSAISEGNMSLDLTSDINWYRMLTYATAGRGTYIHSAPSTVIFTFGPMFPGVECRVDEVRTDIVYWTPQLEPVRARIEITMHRYDQSRVTTANFTMGSPYAASATGYDEGGQAP
jgi:hypothetical protein